MHSPPRILVVDDNETNRDILIARLGTHGYDLLQAADGEEAIEVAHSAQPDLILLDVMMPKLDGIEATKRLKADESLPFMPIHSRHRQGRYQGCRDRAGGWGRRISNQEARYEGDVWEDQIKQYLVEKVRVLISDVARHSLSIETPRVSTSDQRRIAAVLEHLGWERKPKDSRGNRFWGPR
jgi:CheY-like chemotaxis protein